MRRWVIRAIVVTLAAAPVTASAAEFWVSVGSLRELERAEELRAQASEALAISFDLAPAETPAGYFYRVVAGPFTREEAARQAEVARTGGFPKAWMLNQNITIAAGDSSLLGSDYDPGSYAPLPEAPSTYGSDLQVDYPPAPLPVSGAVRDTEEPVLVAPDGYRLNRLERD